MRTLGAATLLTLLLGGMTACTSGGTGGTGSPVTAVSEGSITEIGSIWVNGVEVADFRDDMTASGFIGLQVHSFRGEHTAWVRWRNICIKELKGEK